MQRDLRLTGEKSFLAVHQQGRSWANKLLVLKVTPNSLDVTRFVMPIPDAANLVIKSLEFSSGGEIFVMKMKSISLKDLVEVFRVILKDDNPFEGCGTDENSWQSEKGTRGSRSTWHGCTTFGTGQGPGASTLNLGVMYWYHGDARRTGLREKLFLD